MFVLGIDPGLTTTGYGIIEEHAGREGVVAHGVIRTDPAAADADRLRELHEDVQTLVAEHRPGLAAIEQVFVNRNRRTAVAVARASGVILLALAEQGLAVAEYTPSAVKMALTGSGSADKQQMQKVVAMRLGLEQTPQPPDAADALAVALCHLQHRGAIRAGAL